jgi:hypothetical protein
LGGFCFHHLYWESQKFNCNDNMTSGFLKTCELNFFCVCEINLQSLVITIINENPQLNGIKKCEMKKNKQKNKDG